MYPGYKQSSSEYILRLHTQSRFQVHLYLDLYLQALALCQQILLEYNLKI